MRRYAILTGVLSLLLGIAAILLAVPSVANDRTVATVHTAASMLPKRTTKIASSQKKRRIPLVAAVIAKKPESTYLPAVDIPGITETHKKIATAVLRALPSACRDNLKNFAVLYKNATRRGLGGKTTIILDGSVPDTEFAALLVHECGHVISGNLVGSADSGDSGYRDGSEIYFQSSPMVTFWNIAWTTTGTKKPGMTDNDFISGYAQSDPYEAFAELFAAYVLQRDMVRTHANNNETIALHLAWMEATFPLPEDPIGNGTATWTGAVPWDITKLPLTLALR